jgi:hypothetical protein
MGLLEQYSIADLINWIDDKTLVLNTNFQRRSVWQPAARAYLIDTILRGRSMPKIYMRTKTDPATRRSYREVVDGQQRLKAIYDFANNRITLGTRPQVFGEFAGKSYEQLDDETKQAFLSYQVGVEQLFNASDEDVLDTFHRLNAYGLDLNPQELRHGRYQGDFRNAVVDASKRWSVLWDQYRVVSLRPRVRMADDELMAQMLGVLLEGVQDGGQPTIASLYKKYDSGLDPGIIEKLDSIVAYLIENLNDIMETPLAGAPHFLMLFASVAHARFGIPAGHIPLDGTPMPLRTGQELADLDMARSNLGILSDILTLGIEEIPDKFKAFKYASAGSTQRIRSRRPRFLMLYEALQPEPLYH